MGYLELHDVYVPLHEFALNIPTLKLKKGEFFGVIGSSGAGKSTLLKAIAGLLPHVEGTILLDGEDIRRKAPCERGIAYLFQSPVLFDHLTVQGNLECLLKVRHVPKKAWGDIVLNALHLTSAHHLCKRFPATLSGGEKQRVAIASALMLRPRLLLLDEPFSALDPQLRLQMRDLVRNLVREKEITALFVTHDTEEALGLFERLAVLHQGQIIQLGKAENIYETPQSLHVATYFGIEGIVSGSIRSGCFTCQDFSFAIEHKDSAHVQVVIPSHAVRISKEGICSAVRHAVYCGGRWKIRLENSLTFFTPHCLRGKVTVAIDHQKVSVFEE